jgi:uncharacterized protein YkwD
MAAKLARLTAACAAGAAALTLIAADAASASGCANANADPNAISLRAARKATLCLLNQERRAYGLRPLRDVRSLNRASQRHARDMARHHYFAHGDFVHRIEAVHYLRGARSWTVGENIAWGTYAYATPAAIVNAWMHSPPHRANILNPSFHEIGIGVARGAPVAGQQDGGTYATDFGTRHF